MYEMETLSPSLLDGLQRASIIEVDDAPRDRILYQAGQAAQVAGYKEFIMGSTSST